MPVNMLTYCSDLVTFHQCLPILLQILFRLAKCFFKQNYKSDVILIMYNLKIKNDKNTKITFMVILFWHVQQWELLMKSNRLMHKTQFFCWKILLKYTILKIVGFFAKRLILYPYLIQYLNINTNVFFYCDQNILVVIPIATLSLFA